MKLQPHKVLLTAIVILGVFVIFLFGGAGVTAFAAQNALPGDALYGIKTGLEQTQAVLARDAAIRVELYLEFAERRLDEINKLIAEGRFDDIDTAIDDFEYYVGKALESLQTVAAGDPERASELSQEVFNTLTSYAQTLSNMRERLPAPARQAIDRGITVSQTTSQSSIEITKNTGLKGEFIGNVEFISSEVWVVGGKAFLINNKSQLQGGIDVGDIVKVQFTSKDSILTLDKVELVSKADNANTNENSNDNTNANENTNENANENANLNENDNESGENSNDNQNGDDQTSNENGNENNGNNGGDDQGSNSNSNDNDD